MIAGDLVRAAMEVSLAAVPGLLLARQQVESSLTLPDDPIAIWCLQRVAADCPAESTSYGPPL